MGHLRCWNERSSSINSFTAVPNATTPDSMAWPLLWEKSGGVSACPVPKRSLHIGQEGGRETVEQDGSRQNRKVTVEGRRADWAQERAGSVAMNPNPRLGASDIAGACPSWLMAAVGAYSGRIIKRSFPLRRKFNMPSSPVAFGCLYTVDRLGLPLRRPSEFMEWGS